MLLRRLTAVGLAGGAAALLASDRNPSSALLNYGSTSYELRYFDGKGAVETSRLVMAMSGTPFKDTRWKMDSTS